MNIFDINKQIKIIKIDSSIEKNSEFKSEYSDSEFKSEYSAISSRAKLAYMFRDVACLKMLVKFS